MLLAANGGAWLLCTVWVPTGAAQSSSRQDGDVPANTLSWLVGKLTTTSRRAKYLALH